jgi:predicted short-subunit dehydrogenase-like oxidoreductase (DUF2520 family)
MTFQETRPRALTIIGPGKAGRSLHAAAAGAGIESVLLDRAALANLAGSALHDRIVILAVPDGEIANACSTVCALGPVGAAIGHLSGATPLAALAAAERAGCSLFSMHPLQTFADATTAPTGAYCAITAGDPATAAEVTELATALGMHPFPLADENRAVYHAAASVASNFLVTLEQTAADLLAEAGIEQGRDLLAPLLNQTLSNWVERGPAALTGPIARGDEATVERHLEAIERHAPEIRELYLVLAERTRELAANARSAREAATV